MQQREFGAHLHPELRVQVRQGLVHQERARLADHGSTHRDSLPLSAGQLAGLALHQRGRVRGSCATSSTRCFMLVLRRLAEAQPEPQVLLDRHVGVEGVVLEDHGDVAFLGRQVGHLRVADEDLARRDLLEAREDPQDRRLAATGRADQHHELAVADLQRDVVHGDDVAAEHLAHAGRGRSWPWLPLLPSGESLGAETLVGQGTPNASLRPFGGAEPVESHHARRPRPGEP